MCLSPVSIPNPNFHKTSHASEYGACVVIPKNLISKERYVEVPCGTCAECRNSYYNSILQRGLVEARSSYLYFVTLTYDNNHMPVLVLPTGQEVYYADYSDIQNMFKRFRASNLLDRDFRYLCVNEFGDLHSRPHFHLILFVQKLVDDSPSTPKFICELLFDNLKKFFARNVGTRKHPIYEPLFTYKSRFTSAGIKTNYFVQFVDPKCDYEYTDKSSSDTYLRTLRYLLSYVNKGSSFDDTVEHYLADLTDTVLVNKLRSILRSRVRYSKGFGCGFTSSGKNYLPRISVRTSSNTILFSELHKWLPKEYGLFAETYPMLHNKLVNFVKRCRYSLFSSLDAYMKRLSSEEYYLHCLILNYFPNYFDYIYRTYFREHQLSSPKISYFFFTGINYQKQTVYTSYPNYKDDVYQYLRQGVEEGLSLNVPFIAFKDSSLGSFTALCRYYKERVTDLNDLRTLYSNLGVNDYDAWKKLFIKQKDMKTANKVNSNNFTRFNDDKILKNQKQYLNLPRKLQDLSLYRLLRE